MRDKFQDWNLYHKSIVVLMAAIGFGLLVRAILVFDTAFEVKSDAIINADIATTWLWISDDKNRSRWQAEMVDLVRLTGNTSEVDSTRLAFWQRGKNRWQSTERTNGIIPERALSLIQQSDIDKRWLNLSLEVIAPCQTRLTIEEIIEPTSYSDRFWFFKNRSVHDTRLEISFKSLNKWMETASSCKPNIP
ncbi:SRPBCC family protein [Kordiimonas aquimaris]|uniref:SRPBCC family protein n=1 Tax=Kordiimonas aquimaris TaxID=707591 RepID=UPI0021D2D5A4|nr:SRPBCC family protein [Kordiimonas aquimaris]